MKIKVLPDTLINQIAAGEVVDRPASVVRELLDNALDSGADDIVVLLEHGGQGLIKVSDNGCGMNRDDAVLAFERHATSKIRSLDDLASLHTLGFRGEALPSIAAVSKVLLSTRSSEAATATEVIFEGGTLRGVREGARSVGTDVEVRRLFYNTPARRKFLKSPKNEELRVKQLVLNVALAHPSVRFRLVSDGREVLNLARRSSFQERATSLFRGAVVPFGMDDESTGTLKVRGLVAHPSLAQAESSALVLLVNQRVISDRMLLKAVREGFDSTLKDREFPVGVVALELAPELVDVNVHPQKSEVRFRAPGEVYNAVREVVLRAVRSFKSPVNLGPRPEAARSAGQPAPPSSGTQQTSLVMSVVAGSPAGAPQKSDVQAALINVSAELPPEHRDQFSLCPDTTPDTSRFSNLRYIGQALACYLFCELDGSLYVVDMHAAHERYNYNVIRNRFRNGEMSCQRLLVPLTVELTEAGLRRCLDAQELLARFGFELEAFGATTLLVRAIPPLLIKADIPALLKEVAASPFDDAARSRIEEGVDHLSARLACHASVRSGEGLTREEAYALFAALDSSEFSAACPHGRPVIVRFSCDDVERWFGRDR